MAATKKQLANLAKARAARKRNLAAKKKAPKKKAKRAKTVKKTAAKRAVRKSTRRAPKRNPTTAKEYWVYTVYKKTKFWLQKLGGKWQFHTDKPDGMSESAKNDAMAIAKRYLTRLPAGAHVYLDVKKKKRG